MSTTPVTSVSGLTTDAQKTANATKGLAKDFDDFLTLLTTQLQNQDPLNPMDSSEFTNQLVQFSQVEQQINGNQKLDSLLALQLSTATSAAMGYVGKDISYISSEAYFDGTNPVDLTYSLSGAASTATMRIENEDGETVYSKDVNPATGKNTVTWDGKDQDGNILKSGSYTVHIDALNADGAAVSSTIVTKGRVHGIETQDGAIMLLVGDRAVSMGNVLNASIPPEKTTTSTSNTTSSTSTSGTGST